MKKQSTSALLGISPMVRDGLNVQLAREFPNAVKSSKVEHFEARGYLPNLNTFSFSLNHPHFDTSEYVAATKAIRKLFP
jgi:hypothetical protein